jgi:hypothetical protein
MPVIRLTRLSLHHLHVTPKPCRVHWQRLQRRSERRDHFRFLLKVSAALHRGLCAAADHPPNRIEKSPVPVGA